MAPDSSANKRSGGSGFVSLHKKWLLSLSLLLLMMSVAFGALNYWYLQNRVKVQQVANQAAWQAEFKGLIDHSIDRLQRLSIVLASLGQLTDYLKNPHAAVDSSKLLEKFTSVRYELDVERITVFNKNGEIRWNWSPYGNNTASSQFLMEKVKRLQKSEQTEAGLNCRNQCELNVIMPLLEQGKHVGYIALSQRITDLVVEFSTATGVDLGILIPDGSETATAFPRWPLAMAALTHASKLRPLIEHLSQLYVSPMAIPNSVEIPWNKEFYLISSQPLSNIIKDADGYYVFVSNVSESVFFLQRSNRNSLLLLAASLIFAEIFLLQLLRRPLKRIGHLARTLPLVAQGGYREAYQEFNRHGVSKKLLDEIDILYQSSIDLTHQIEKSQLELASDRDFIQGLLDSAQVMILTQTHEGKIHTVNHYMAQLLGRSTEDLTGESFIDLIIEGEGKSQYECDRPNLFSSIMPRLEHEGSIIDAKGEQRHIIWNHTYLHIQTGDVAVLSVGMDATDRILAENRSRWLAHHDPLTGLANRLRFHEELDRSFADAMRSRITTALMLIDLDYFKTVNDTSGHAAGDSLLKTLANELRLRARKSDLVVRLGGDEFAVLMPNTGQVGAEAFAQSLNERLKNHLFKFGEKEYRISCSIGIALMPDHGENVEELMVNVDSAMYQAKKRGRGRHHFYSAVDESVLLN
jgi:diguanylate cyclase (GGDEF)-like protein/PAS domain S-box-containing protein